MIEQTYVVQVPSFNYHADTNAVISKLGHVIAYKKDNTIAFAEVEPFRVCTNGVIKNMYTRPIMGIRKDAINKDRLMAMFAHGKKHTAELVEQYANDNPYLLFSVLHNLRYKPTFLADVDPSKCIYVDAYDTSNGPTVMMNTNGCSRNVYELLHNERYDVEEDKCNFIGYVHRHICTDTTEQEPNPVVQEPVKQEKVIDKSSHRYQTLYVLCNGNEELIKKMY